MVWWYASTRHELAISPWVRTWLRASFIDRFFLTFVIGLPWWMFWGFFSILAGNANALGLLGWVPWIFWVADTIVDHYHTNGDITNLMTQPHVVLATRAEYVGGHPLLPHGRFCYLALRGTQENPMLTMEFPNQNAEADRFDVPLLDIAKTTPKAEPEQTITGSILASLNERAGRFLSGERVTLTVDYQGPGGRKHKVDLTSFFRGGDEVRNWRNYLVCAQAEADTGTTPFGPWKSLKPAEVKADDGDRQGDKVQPARRAFERR